MRKQLRSLRMIVSRKNYQLTNKSVFIFLSLFALMPFQSIQAQSTTCEPGSVSNSNSDPWSVECYLNSSCDEQGNPCTANDVNLTGSFLADEFGNPIGTFPPGAMIEVYLWGEFLNGTGTGRYAVRTDTELWIDGMFVEDINNCSFDELFPGTATAILTGPFFFQSGQQIELRNTWIGWETSSGAQCSDPDGANYAFRCGQYSPSKCSKTYEAIPLLVPNFNFSCGDATATTTEVCFQDLTTGGVPPYTYSWDFGDGNSSTLEAPCHIYNSTTDVYTVTLSVQDSEGNIAEAFLVVDLDNLVCPEPSLNVQKLADPSTFTQEGDVINYTITVENTGNVVISDLVVSDPLADQPPVYVSGDDNNNDVLDVGEVWLYTASYTITSQDVINGLFTNEVTADGTPNGGVLEPANDFATVNLIGLDVSKTADVQTYASVGDVITYTIVVENISSVTISDIIVDDPLIGAITNFNIGSLAPGGEYTFTETYEITLADLQAGVVNNTATAIGNGPDNEEVSGTDNETVTALWADLSVTKTGSPDPVFAGNVITYTIQVNNSGPDAALNVVLTDVVPGSILSPTFSIDNGVTWNEWTGTYEYGNLAAGDNFSVLLSGTVDPAAPSQAIENTASVNSDTFDPDLSNNIDTETTDVEVSADLSVLKVASDDPATAGEELIYTLTITNLGPSNALAVQVSDNIPSALLSPEFSTDDGVTWTAWSSPYSHGSLEAGGSIDILIRGTLNPSITDNTQISNTANVSSSTPDPDLDNNTSTVVITVVREADLSVVKSQIDPADLPAITVIDPSQAVPGTKIYYLLVVENFGPSYATNALVTDNLPAGITNAQYSLNLGNSWFAWDGTRPLANFEFPGINNILLRGDIDPDLVGVITNTATITSDTPDPNPDNNIDSVETLLTPLADLAIIKEVVGGGVSLNETITYRLTIDNNGPSTATDIIVEDIIDANLIQGAEYSFDNQEPWTTWPANNLVSVGDLGPFAPEITLFIRGTLIDGIQDPNDPNVLQVPNTATVTSPVTDPNPDNNTFTVVTTLDVEADLELVKTGPATVIAGNTITYTLTVTNLSTEFDSENVIVEDIINTTVISSPEYSFDEVSWTAWPATNVLPLGTISPTASVTFFIRGVVASDFTGTGIINTAEVFSSTPDPNIDNDKDTWTTQVIREADLEIVKLQIDPAILPLDENNLPENLQELSIDPMEIIAGETIYYLLVYTNYGPSDATNVIITDDVPAVIEDVEASRCQANFAAYSGVSNLGTVVSGGRCILVIRGTVNTGATGVITNTASITSDVDDPDLTNNVSTIVTQIVGNADLLIQKTGSPNPVTAGEEITYTITVENLGPSDAFDVWVNDAIPSVVLDPEYTQDGGANWFDWTGQLSLGTVTYSEIISFQIRGTVDPGALQGSQIENIATVTSTVTPDPNPNNNTSTATNNVNRLADLVITKVDSPDPVIPGNILTYTITVENLGPSDASNVVVTDDLPSELHSVNATPTLGSWSAPTWTIGTMAAGTVQTLTITAIVSELADGTIITNTAVVQTSTPDPDPDNNTSTTTTTVTASPQLTLTKTADKTSGVSAGETITYTFVVENTGNVTLNNIGISDNHSGTASLSAFDPIPPVSSLAVGASVTFTATYEVTQQDINLQNDIVNTATATATYAGNNYSSSDNETVVLEASEPLVEITKNGQLKLDIIEPNDVANAGDEVIYTFIVKNDGNVTLYDVVITDPLPGITIQNSGFIGTMEPGDEVTLIGSYTLMQTDIDAGVISNTATVDAEDPQGNPVSDSDSDIQNLPASGSIELLKAGTFNDENGDGFAQEGETITYSFSVTNTGNVTISNLVINDAEVGVANLAVVPSTLLPGESGAASISYTITQEDIDAGGVYNLALATGQDPNGDPVEDQSSDPNPLDPDDPNYDPDCPDCTYTELPQDPAIELLKSSTFNDESGDGFAQSGETITYNFSVTNTGNVTISNLVINDAEVGVANLAVVPSTLLPGESGAASISYTITQEDIDAGGVYNLALATGQDPNGDPVEDESSDPNPLDPDDPNYDPECPDCTYTELPQDPAIELLKAGTFNDENGDGFAQAGETITYSFTVENTGNVTISNLVINDAEVGVANLAVVPSTLLPGEIGAASISYTITQEDIDAGGVYNLAVATGQDPNGDPVEDESSDPNPLDPNDPNYDPDCPDCTYTELPQDPAIELLKAGTFNDENGDGFAQEGETITYSFSVTNTGNVTISNLEINDTDINVTNLAVLPSTLAPGATGLASVTYTITQADVDAGGVYNLALATGNDPQGGTVTDTSTDPNPLDPNDPNYDPECPDCTFTELPQEPGLAITKTANQQTYAEDDIITYTIVLENTGNVTLNDVVVDDPLLPEITSENIGALAPGATYTLTGTYVITITDMMNGEVENIATATGTFNNTPYSNSDDETITAIRADLAITKTGPNTITAGEEITYTITVNNLGPNTAENVEVTDVIPSEISSAEFSTDGGATWNPWINPYSYGNLPAGQNFSFQIRGTVNNNTPEGTIISNTAVVGSDTFDHVPANNTSTKETDVNTSADLEIEKVASSEPVIAGTVITYTLTVTNHGPSDAQAVQVSDNVPSGISNVNFSDDGGATWNPWSSPYVYGALESGGNFSLLISGLVNPALAENTTLTNTATVSSSTPDPDLDNNTSTVITTVIREADLSVVKSQIDPADLPAITVIDPSQAVPGTKIYYLLVVENFGPSYATNALVTDNLPAGITNAQYSLNLGNSWFSWDGTRNLANFEFPGINNILLRGDIDSELVGVITNTATITSDTPDPILKNNEDSVETLLTPLADLAIIKEVVGGAVGINQPITYRLTIDNNGPSTATDIIVEDIIDTDLIASPEYSLDNQATWTDWPANNEVNVGSLAPFAAEIELFISGTLIAGIPELESDILKVPNTATVTSSVSDPDLSNNTSSIVTTLDVEADLELVKTGPATVIAGNTITYTLTVTNLSTEFDSENVIVEDIINTTVINNPEYSLDGIDWLIWPASNVLPLGTVSLSTTVTFYIRGDVASDAPGTITNTAEVFSSTPDPNIENDKDSWATQVIREADLEVVKLQIDPAILPLDENNLPDNLQDLSIDPMEIIAGETIYYLLVYTNYGPSDATNVIITDVVPGVIEDVEASRCQANFVAYSNPSNLGTVVSGGRCILVIRGTVNTGATGVITNTASITSDVEDPDDSNNESTIVTQIVGNADLLIQKTGAPNPVTAGEEIIYTLTVTNLGPSDALDVQVFDDVPPTILDPEYFDGNDWVLWPGYLNYGDLPNGDNFSFQIRGTVDPSVPQTTQIVNVATVTSTLTPDPDPSNNTSSTTNSVNRFADLEIVKSADPEPVIPGQTLTYTVVVENLGPSDAANVVVTDNLPAGLSSINVTPSTGTWSAPNWTVGNMPVGSTQTMTITAVVDELPDGTVLVNTATVNSSTNDPDPDNNTSTVTSTITASPQISLSKTADETANVQAGETITYTYVVTNTGNVVMSNIILADDHSGTGTLSAFDPVPPISSLAVGASVTFTATYVMTQEDIDTQLAISNVATATATFAGEEYSDTDVENVTPVAGDPAIVLVKEGEYLGNPEAAVVDDQILYTFTVTNTGNLTISGLVIDDAIVGASGLVVDPSTLAPGEVGTVTLLYSITQDDIDAGQVVNSALATGTDPQGGTVTDTSGTAIDNDTPTTTDLPQDPAIALVKTGDYQGDPSAAEVGDNILYTFTVTNTGNVTVSGLVIDDAIVGASNLPVDPSTLLPGDVGTVTLIYSITQADINAGQVVNSALATGTDPQGGTVTDTSGTSIDNDQPTITDLPQDPSITMNKSATLINGMVPDPFAYSQVGDIITYTFDVKNTGNVTLYDVTVDDAKVSGLDPAAYASLAPDATANFSATYEVVLADILVGTITNTATAEAEDPNGDPVSSAPDTEIVPARPTAVDDAYTTSVNAPADGDVSTNDLYPDGSTFAVVDSPSNGTITTFDPNTGEFTYMPDTDFTGVDSFTYTVCFNFDGVDYCDEATVTITVISDCITIETWVYLEGSVIDPGGFETYNVPMRTSLNNLKILPGQTFFDPLFGNVYSPPGQPYNVAPWYYNGNEGDGFDSYGVSGTSGYPETVVDWVLVSLRADAAGTGGPVCQAAALLHNDGTVEFIESFSCCGIAPGNAYYIVIEHRNHLIVMSHEAVALESSDGINYKLSYDFRNQQSYIDEPAIYVGQKQVTTPSESVYVMFGGNGDQTTSSSSDTDINFNDRSFWEAENSIFGRYRIGDYNMNGDTNFNDRLIWEINNGKTSSVPRN